MAEPIVFANATVVDGTGAAPFPADVRVVGERIDAVAPPGSIAQGRQVDCTGRLLTPGFIDIHSHSDLTLLLDPRASSAIHQGVTLEVIGNCGHGCAPLRDLALARSAMYGPVPAAGFFGWRTMAGYLERLAQARPAINVLALVPNGQLRLAHVGRQPRPARDDELAAMGRDLEAALDAGAHGFSSGLEYVQENACSTDEIDALCRIVARRGGLYATHTRDRDRRALEAIDEAIGTARRTGVRLQISHITPRSGMPGTIGALERVDRARADGLDVGFDMHTRLFGFTHLKNLLPMWALEGGPGDILRRLQDPQALERIRQHPNLISGVGDWSRIVLVDSVACADLNGLEFTTIAARRGCAPFEAAMAVLRADVEQLQRPMVLLQTYTEEMLRTTYQHPGCMPGSDATTLAPDGPLAGEVFHGAYTWASWFLRRMVRETGALTLQDAVYRMTSLPAARLGLADRGRIAPGCCADLVLLDWARYQDRGTVEAPSQLAQGVEMVLVNGGVVLAQGQATGVRTGRVIR
ncbi:MAG: amidohydrolase family protein [Rhodoferax sp.]